MSAGDRISRRELVSSRNPFSPQASGTTPALSTICMVRLPTSLPVMASRPAWSCERKGNENRFSSFTCGDQLMVEPMAISITPWRMAENSRVWSPLMSDTPGYILMLIRPWVRSRTRLPQISPPLPQGKAGPTTVDSRYSARYCCACDGRMMNGAVSAVAPAVPAFRTERRSMVCLLIGGDRWHCNGHRPMLQLAF